MFKYDKKMSKFIIKKEVEEQVYNLVTKKLREEARKIIEFVDGDLFVKLTPELIEHIIKMSLNWEKEDPSSISFMFYEEWTEQQQEEFRGMVGTWVYIEKDGFPWNDIMEHEFFPKDVFGYFADDLLKSEWWYFNDCATGCNELPIDVYKLYLPLELYRRNGIEGEELNKRIKKITGYKL